MSSTDDTSITYEELSRQEAAMLAKADDYINEVNTAEAAGEPVDPEKKAQVDALVDLKAQFKPTTPSEFAAMSPREKLKKFDQYAGTLIDIGGLLAGFGGLPGQLIALGLASQKGVGAARRWSQGKLADAMGVDYDPGKLLQRTTATGSVKDWATMLGPGHFAVGVAAPVLAAKAEQEGWEAPKPISDFTSGVKRTVGSLFHKDGSESVSGGDPISNSTIMIIIALTVLIVLVIIIFIEDKIWLNPIPYQLLRIPSQLLGVVG